MTVVISSLSGGALLTSRSVSGSCTSAKIKAGGLVRTSLKCSAHLASCSDFVVSCLSCLSTIGGSVAQRYLLLPSLLTLYTCPCSSLSVTSSALLARSSMQARLSALVILLTVWSASRYCCLHLTASLIWCL